MAYKSAIQWTDATHNFWTGCQKVSQGCKGCYMWRMLEAEGKDPSVVVRSSKSYFSRTLEWKEPRKIFTCSMSDFFIADADTWRAEAWDVIKRTPQHKWLILTKRSERIAECLPDDWGSGYRNVALGVTVESQETVERMHILADIPAHVRFISAEPLIEPVDLTVKDSKGQMSLRKMNQVIIGGESGNESGKYKARVMEISWVQRMIDDIRDSSGHTGIFIKQLGSYQVRTWGLKHPHGGDMNEFPKRLRIREEITHPGKMPIEPISASEAN